MLLLITIIVVALVFDYTNGFHDTANAIATSVSTRALSPRVAVIMAASLNLIGALALHRRSPKTVGKGLVDTDLVTLAAGPRGAHRRRRLELHHLVLRHPLELVARALRRAHRRHDRRRRRHRASSGSGVLDKVIMPMVGSPVLGFVVRLAPHDRRSSGWCASWPPAPVNRWFRILQPISAGFMAFSHGGNDAQKTMGIITLALFASGEIDDVRRSPSG